MMLELRLKLSRREFMINAELQIPSGTTYCLFGPSGSGKSSILSVIAGFEQSYHFAILKFDNRIFVDTSKQPNVNVPTWLRGFGYLEQSDHLFPHLTVWENISYGIPRNSSRQWLNTLIERLDLTSLLTVKPRKLSGGQKQRVSLARALALKPRLLLLDEPFSALDWQAKQSLQQAIAEWQNELGFTILLVTHQLSEAQRLANCIGLIDHGHILQEGSPAALFAHPKNKRAAQLLGYSHFLSIANGQTFGVHADCAVIGRCPEQGVSVQGTISALYEYSGRRRIRVNLSQYESAPIEVNLPLLNAPNLGETIDLTFINPPFFID